MKKIFITGIGGCVGHYLFDVLANNPDYELFLLVRNPQKLKFDYKSRPNINVINDDFSNIEKHAGLVKQMDAVIHIAADWGGNEANYDYTLSLFKMLDPNKCKKVVYFSTASILNSNNKPNEAAGKYGTHYIRSKYRLYKKLPELKIYPNVVTLFPTWILGGDKGHPYSHASTGIKAMRGWLWLIRFFTIDTSFHFIHARDIAAITKHLLENETKEKAFVLGNAPLTASELIKQVCRYFGLKTYFQLPISPALVKSAAFIFGRKLHPWDLYCIEKRHFTYQAVNVERFGYSSNLITIEQILKDLEN